MSTIIPFPRRARPHLEHFHGVDKTTGRPVYVLEHVDADGFRFCIGVYETAAEFDRAVRWCQSDDDIAIWPDGAA